MLMLWIYLFSRMLPADSFFNIDPSYQYLTESQALLSVVQVTVNESSEILDIRIFLGLTDSAALSLKSCRLFIRSTPATTPATRTKSPRYVGIFALFLFIILLPIR